MADRVVPAVEFVGRSEELAVLGREFGSALQGHPRTVCISGGPGLGKTHLIREFLRGAGSHLLLWASGDRTESELSYGVTDQLFAALAADGHSPVTAHSTRDENPSVAADPKLVGAALVAEIEAAGGPVVLVVDDFDLADRESADALLFLLRRLRTQPVLTIITAQPYRYQGKQPDASWWRFLTDPATTTRLPLSGLAADDLALLAQLLGHNGLTRATVHVLHEHTDGHPRHFRALLDEVGVAELSRTSHPLPAPRSLTGLIRARFELLSPAGRGLVAAGAVLGPSFAPELAADVGQIADAASALDEARDAGMLEIRPDGAGFPDSLTHAALYHALPSGRRRSLHRRAARVTSGAVALHHRAAATVGYDPDLAGELMALAAAQAGRGEYPRAADNLMQAARLIELLPLREQILLRAVALMSLSNDPARAEVFRTMVQSCADGPARTLVLGLMAFAAGRMSEAQALLNRVVEADAGAVDGVQRTRAAVPLAFACLHRGDWKAALAAADLADTGSLDWERSVALTAAVLALARLGRTAEALERVEDFRLSDPAGPGSVDRQGACGLALLLDGDPAGAEIELARAVHRAETGEPVRLVEFILTNLAESRFVLGRWDQADAALRTAISLATDGSRFDALLRAHSLSAWIAAAQGRYADAEQHIAAAAAVPGSTESAFGGRLVAMSRAVLAGVRGEAAAMLAAVAAPVGGELDADLALSGLPIWQVVAVQALVVGGPAPVAARAVRRLADRLQQPAYRPWADEVTRLRGLLAEAAGDLDTAEGSYREGLHRPAGALDAGLSRARLHAAYGHVLAKARRRREAIEHLRAARGTFVALGATPFRERCEEDMALCGLPIPGRHDPDATLLTAAELRVARLVAQGLSNRDVAGRLYISTKTVEYHLGHVFAKLGLTSRSSLAPALTSIPGEQ